MLAGTINTVCNKGDMGIDAEGVAPIEQALILTAAFIRIKEGPTNKKEMKNIINFIKTTLK